MLFKGMGHGLLRRLACGKLLFHRCHDLDPTYRSTGLSSGGTLLRGFAAHLL